MKGGMLMYPEIVRSTLTLPKILGGLSKTIGVIREAIPLYQQAKPLWNNAKTALKVLKVMNEPDKKNPVKTATSSKVKEAEIRPTISAPQFFQ